MDSDRAASMFWTGPDLQDGMSFDMGMGNAWKRDSRQKVRGNAKGGNRLGVKDNRDRAWAAQRLDTKERGRRMGQKRGDGAKERRRVRRAESKSDSECGSDDCGGSSSSLGEGDETTSVAREGGLADRGCANNEADALVQAHEGERKKRARI
jgi:hypothetical protein